MKYAYFPGCTLHTQADNFRLSCDASCRELGLELAELQSWECCGAVFPLSTDNRLPLASPFRTLARAHATGQPLLTLCSACYNVLKRTNYTVSGNAEVREKLEAFVELPYAGQGRVVHLLEAIRDDLGWGALRARVKRPLSGLPVAAYYGCLLLRPQEELQFDDPENPRVLEELVSALGAKPVLYPHRAECCGAYLGVRDSESTLGAVRTILQAAGARGARVLVTSCPLCFYNLDSAQARISQEDLAFKPLPVLYFTQLLALALGAPASQLVLSRHQVDPWPALQELGLGEVVA
ncbi:MAG: CoB--CoM heterodisulfide reductase iron-sulfur subunit B family protein [Bacillota bacterium]